MRTRATAVLFALAVFGPAFAVGGVLPACVPAFALAVAALVLVAERSRGDGHDRGHDRSHATTVQTGTLPLPRGTSLGLLALTATALPLLPLPESFRVVLAPRLEATIQEGLLGTTCARWPSLTAVPFDGVLELLRIAALTGLFVVARGQRWLTLAVWMSIAALAVAISGYIHLTSKATAIYGLYRPLFVAPEKTGHLLGPFVNGNHQASFMLLGLFCCAAVAYDARRTAKRARTTLEHRRAVDTGLAATIAVAAIVPAIVLTGSRAAIAILLLSGVAAGSWVTSQALRLGLPPRPRPRIRWVALGQALALFALMAAAVVTLASPGDLATLGSPATFARELAAKWQHAFDALGLVAWSPIFGLGRGGFVDLFPRVATPSGAEIHTHLETFPIALAIEWGPIASTTFLVGAFAWWGKTLRAQAKRRSSTARRLLLWGLLAVTVQNTVDHGFEFLGVTAPVVALAGALTPYGGIAIGRRTRRVVAAMLTVAAVLVASFVVPRAWSAHMSRRASLAQSTEEACELLTARPVDPLLHLALAQRAWTHGDLASAEARAAFATRALPNDPSPWLVLAVVHETHARASDAQSAWREAISRATRDERQGDLAKDVLGWLTLRYEPTELARLMPVEDTAAHRFIAEVLEVSPRHALELATVRTLATHDRASLLQLQVTAALRLENPPLSLHYARLLAAEDPGLGLARVRWAEALESFAPPRYEEALGVLRSAAADPALANRSEDLLRVRGSLFERLATRTEPNLRAEARALHRLIMDSPQASRAERVHWEALLRAME